MRTGFINGKLYGTEATGFIVNDHLFEVFSDDETIKENCEHIIDLKGMAVYPGFNDTHMHLVNLGFYLSNLPCNEFTSLKEMYKAIAARVDVKGHKWIRGRGFIEEQFEEKRMPTKKELDAISTEVPICLTRVCGHRMICNSKALEMADISEDGMYNGGKIYFDLGIVEENAIDLVQAAWPIPSQRDIEEYIALGMKECNKYGITSVGSDDFISITNEYDEALAALEGMGFRKELTVRVNEQCHFNCIEDFAKFLDEGYTTDMGDEFFRIGPLKLIMDGSLGACTAYMSEEYLNQKGNKGYPCLSKKELEQYIKLAAHYNMPSAIHVIGDGAVDMVLDAYEDVVLEGNPLHHGLVHVQITRKDQLERIIKNKYVCYIQGIFIDYDSLIVKERVKEETLHTSYAFKTLMEGTLCANGSDAPVEMPSVLKGIQCAVTRKSVSYGTGMNPSEALSVQQAIDSFTINGAKMSGEEAIKGSLEAGKLADFVILDQCIEECDPEMISMIHVLSTYMDGKEVYHNDSNYH